MYEIIQALGAGNAGIIYGAGPSCQVGLPSWGRLANDCLGKAEGMLNREIPSARAAIAAGRLDEALGVIARTLAGTGIDGKSALDGWIRQATQDPGGNGRIYELLARLPAHLYITTNYDCVFERHLRQVGATPEVHTYTQTSLEEVDISAFDKTVVHVHGRADDTLPLVATDSDYHRVRQANEFKALRRFMQSHFTVSSILMIGFSMSDPNVRSIARQVSAEIRRKQQPIVILADASRDQAREFSREFNVEVVPSSSDNDFAELESSLALAVKWLEAPQTVGSIESADMRLSQALYVMKAVQKAGDTVALQATKALCVNVLSQCESLTHDALGGRLRIEAGVSERGLTFLEAALDDLATAGIVRMAGDTVALTPEGLEMADLSSRRLNRIWTNLSEDVELHAQGDGSLGAVLRDVLVSLFSERAAEAVCLAFSTASVQTSSLDLYDTIAAASARIADGAMRFRFMAYVVDMLRRPNTAQRTIMDYLGKALFCSHALSMDAPTSGLAAGRITEKALLVDSNVLISLMALGSPLHEDTRRLVESARDAGITLLTTHGFIEECERHARWAREFEESHLGDDVALLSAATGTAGFDGNEFLSGFVAWRTEAGVARIHPYLTDCTGNGLAEAESITATLSERWGISIVNVDPTRGQCVEYDEVLEQTMEFVRSGAGFDKTSRRMKSEAEAYSIMYCWPDVAAALSLPATVLLLSAGGYLNKIARQGPRPIDHNVVITPFALAGFLSTYVNSNAIHDFSTMIRAEFFGSSAEFLDEALLEKSFDDVIVSAERVYVEKLRPLVEQLEQGLLPDDFPEDLSGIPRLKRPEIVQSLGEAIRDFVSPSVIAEVKAENRLLKQRVSDFEEDEARSAAVEEKRKKGKAKYDRAQERRTKGL
jgi:hypothetical protein